MTVLVFELFGRDNSASRTFDNLSGSADRAGRRISRLSGDADSATRSFNPLEIVLTGVHRALVQNAAAMAKATAAFGGLASTALTLAPYLAQAAQSVWAVAEAALGASPALIGMGVVGAAAFATLKLGFSDFGTALKQGDTPAQIKKINEALASLHPEARKVAEAVRGMHPQFEKIKRSVQGEIFKNLAHDVKAVGDQFLTKATPGMVRFGGAVNSVIRDMLSWGGSLAGVRATEQVTNAMYIGMSRLHPSITRVTSSFGNMIGRIAEVSTAAGVNGLGGILDWLAERMDKVNAASVSKSLADLRNKFDATKEAITQFWHKLQELWRMYEQNRTAISLLGDALSVLAIAFGGPIIAIGAAIGLIIRHWDDLKAAKAGLQAAMATPVGVGFLEDMRVASSNIVPALVGAWNTIWEAIGPRLTEIWNKIKNELIPALGDLIAALSPIVAFCVSVLGPVVASVFDAILRVIQGAVSIITGIVQVFAGLLTGNWSQMWEGVKNIFSGVWDAIVGLLNLFIFGRIANILGRMVGLIGGLFGRAGSAAIDAVRGMGTWVERSLSDLIARIPGVLGNVTRLLYEAGRGIVQGLINGILSMINAAGNAMASVARKIRNMLPFSPAKEGPLSGRGGPDLAGAKIAAMVADGMIKGVPQVVGAAYQLAGAARLGGLPQQSSLLGAGAIAMAGAGRSGGYSGPPIVLQGDGTRFIELLLETIRKAVSDRGGDVQGVLGR